MRKGADSQWEASTQLGTTKGPQERPSQMTPSRGSQVHTGLRARDERAREPLPTLPQTPLPQQPGQTQLLEVTGHCCRPMTRPSGTPLHPLCSCFPCPSREGAEGGEPIATQCQSLKDRKKPKRKVCDYVHLSAFPPQLQCVDLQGYLDTARWDL